MLSIFAKESITSSYSARKHTRKVTEAMLFCLPLLLYFTAFLRISAFHPSTVKLRFPTCEEKETVRCFTSPG